MNRRIFLSTPHMGGDEASLVREVFDSNWIAPLGPQVDAFEREFADLVGSKHAAALSSGTAALHLALILAGVGPGDEVLASTLTFSATINPIRYQGATPVLVDSDATTWNIDPALVAEAIESRVKAGHRPKAVIPVHLYGQCADIDPIAEACARHGIVMIEDAAEALGASYKGRAPGSMGATGIFSFNGNKIITTSGGGMLVSNDEALITHARKLATQARDAAPHYQHSEIGYNYRLSNVLAAIGRGQLRVLEDRVLARRRIFARYRSALGALPGIAFMPEEKFGDERSRSNRWLSCITIDPDQAGITREDVRLALETENVETRPVWKPMHLQPIFADCPVIGGSVAAGLFANGLCLPSGSSLTEAEQDRVIDLVQRVFREARRPAGAIS
jgi:dTDP-4-amino-4,6-dideoxygalactose transaminase